MMTMATVSDVPLPRPKWPASLGCEGLPLPSEDEYLALMIAEFGLLPPLFAQDEPQAMLIDDDEVQATTMAATEKETQASPPPPTPAPVLPVALSSDNQEHGKKRKNPPPPASTEDAKNGAVLQPRPSKRAKKKKLPSRRAQNKMVATRILDREFCAPEPSQGCTVLRCLCQELPRGSPGCALHQAAAPCRSWMKKRAAPRGCIPAVGGAGAVLVPKQDTDGRRAACEYMRWRGRVWMPSRFYVEHAQAEMARLG